MKFATDELQRNAEMPTWDEYVKFTAETATYPGVNRRDETVPTYVQLGLRSEVCELGAVVYGALKRELRDGGNQWTLERIADVRAEIGDVLWYCARYAIHEQWTVYHAYPEGIDEAWNNDPWLSAPLAEIMDEAVSLAGEGHSAGVIGCMSSLASRWGWTLAEIAAENMAKLRDRKARGVIQGQGDHR